MRPDKERILNRLQRVSIHAPREGCDEFKQIDLAPDSKFQFTHPGRGATGAGCSLTAIPRGFNSRTPGGVRLARSSYVSQLLPVSIHAPREGCDIKAHREDTIQLRFNSRTPGGVRLAVSEPIVLPPAVSIHAPREGCDRMKDLLIKYTSKFQFTHPGRGATSEQPTPKERDTVSIHAPREGCDR